MNFYQYLLILKARSVIIISTMLIIVISTIAYNLVKTKEYQASVSLVLNYKGVDPVTGVVFPAQLLPGYMATQIDVITSRNVAVKVVDQLGLANSDVIKQQFQEENQGKGEISEWLANRLLQKLDVKPSRESSVIEIVYTGADPDFVALIANAFADAYQKTNVELKVDPAKKAATFLNVQVDDLKSKLESAQSKLSQYLKVHGITSTSQGLDVELAKLNELSSQLVMVQGLLYDSKSRGINSVGESGISPDVAANGLIQNLKLQVSMAETKLSEISQRYGLNHPLYLSAKAELDKQRSMLNREISSASKSINKTISINKQKESQLLAAYEAQKNKILNLNSTRDELKVLENEVFSAQKALDLASSRYNETNQESSSNQSDITILNRAIPPNQPSSPKVMLNILLSIFVGTIIGVTLGLLREMLDRKVRSQADISDLFEIPVFSISSNKPKRENKLLILNNRKLLGFK